MTLQHVLLRNDVEFIFGLTQNSNEIILYSSFILFFFPLATGSTGALSRLLNKETAPVGKIVPAKSTTAAPAAAAAKFTPSVQRNRVIPGMAPPGAAPTGAAAGNNNNKKAPVSNSVASNGAKSAPKAAPAPVKVTAINYLL